MTPYTRHHCRCAPSIRDIFRRVLEVDDVTDDSDFFDAGGDSLLATRVLSAVAREFGVELTFDDFVLAPTPGRLAAQVASRLREGRGRRRRARRADRRRPSWPRRRATSSCWRPATGSAAAPTASRSRRASGSTRARRTSASGTPRCRPDRDLGLKTMPTGMDGRQPVPARPEEGGTTRHGRFPPLNAVALGDMFDLLDELVRTVDPDAPWLTPGADELDRLTAAEWADTHLHREDARLFFPLFLGEMMAADPADVSMLHMAFYLRSGGGIRYLNAFEGGAQDSRVDGGAHQVCELLAERLPAGTVRLGEPVHAIDEDRRAASPCTASRRRATPTRWSWRCRRCSPTAIDLTPALPRRGRRRGPGAAARSRCTSSTPSRSGAATACPAGRSTPTARCCPPWTTRRTTAPSAC